MIGSVLRITKAFRLRGLREQIRPNASHNMQEKIPVVDGTAMANRFLQLLRILFIVLTG